MSPGAVVGWIVVAGFAATFVITLLALCKKIDMEPQYLKSLFGLLVLELIAAAFFLFEQEYASPDVAFEPDPVTKSVHLCDSDGKPIQETALMFGEDEVFNFPALDLTNKRREFEIEDKVVVVKADDVPLGSLSYPEIKAEINPDPLTVREHLYLGLHLAECTKVAPETQLCVRRKDSAKSAGYLFAALNNDDRELNDEEKDKAVSTLYNVRMGLEGCEQYKTLAEWSEDIRPRRQIEVADIYLDLSNRRELDANVKRDARLAALKYYQAYCDTSNAVDTATACERASELRALFKDDQIAIQGAFVCG